MSKNELNANAKVLKKLKTMAAELESEITTI